MRKSIVRSCIVGGLLAGVLSGADITAVQAASDYAEKEGGSQEIKTPVRTVFEDVNEGDWFESNVQYVYDEGIMKGTDDTHFKPNDPLARAQFAVMLHRMNGKPEAESEITFEDVEDGQWYTDAIVWAAGTGVVKGYDSNGLFGTADNINREQMAVMMYRYADYLKYDLSKEKGLDSFSDASSVNEFAETAMKWAVGNDIITGKQEGTVLDPQGNAARAECAAIVERFLKNMQTEDPEKPDPPKPDDPVEPLSPKEYMEAVRKQMTEKEVSGITDELPGVDYGTLKKYTYYSSTAQRNTNVNVLLPAGYSQEEEYPVLYVLHGYWGTEDALLDPGDASLRIRQIVGNLTAQGKAEKMIVVFPYIYCSKDKPVCTGLDLENSLNYDNFINDLTTDLMPYIENNFAAAAGKENTAITGFSMGGRESLFIGLTRTDLFGYIGAVCPAPGLTPGTDLNLHPGQLKEEELIIDSEKGEPYLIMVSAAVNDGVVGNAPYNYDSILTRNKVDHVWHTVSDGDHGGRSIRPHIYNFARSIFKKDFDEAVTPEVNEWDNYQETDSVQMQGFYNDAIYNMGNTSRLRNKIQKAQNGGNVKVAYLGGSITEGVGMENTCYARRSYEYFADTFGTGNNVEYINKGLSGTSSAVGLIRAQYDILNDKPDVIFIEFSVNDHPDELYKKSFEGLVRQCLSQEQEPAVIILINRSRSGYSMQEQMAAVGKNYNVPVLSMDNSLTKAFDSGLLKKDDYFTDEYHPHAEGGKLIADTIAYYYRQALKTENKSESYKIPDTTVYGTEYAAATLAPPWELQNIVPGSFKESSSNYRFPYGWKFEKGSSNTPMTFQANGKGIFILYQSNQDNSFGNLKVTVNGKTSVISGKRNYAWGGPDTEVAYIQNESGLLDVSVCMENADTEFSIWGIGVIK